MDGTAQAITSPFHLLVNRFLLTTDDWYKARIRIFIYADLYLADHAKIQYRMDQVLEDLKVNAEINLVDTGTDIRQLNEIIKSSSATTDLIYLDLPPMDEENNLKFFKDTDTLCKEIGTVILYTASSHFQEIDIDLQARAAQQSTAVDNQRQRMEDALLMQRRIELPEQKTSGSAF